MAEKTKPQILLAEHEDILPKALKTLLSDEGYDVTEVTGGQQALDALKAQNFRLMIADINLPEMDGVQLVSNIAEETRQNMYIILLADMDDIQQIMTIGQLSDKRLLNPVNAINKKYSKDVVEGVQKLVAI